MTDTQKLDLILQKLEILDKLEHNFSALQQDIQNMQASQELLHSSLDSLQKSLEAHQIHTDARFQNVENRIDMRSVDVETQIGSLSNDMIERFHSTLDHIDGQAKISYQRTELAENRMGYRFMNLKDYFDSKFTRVHNRFVEVQEDLDAIRQQTVPNSTANHNKPRRPTTR